MQRSSKRLTTAKQGREASGLDRTKLILAVLSLLIAAGALVTYIWDHLQTRSNFLEQQRPRVSISKLEIRDPISDARKEPQTFDPGTSLRVNVVFKNRGNTTAYRLTPRYYILFGSQIQTLGAGFPAEERDGVDLDSAGEGVVTAVSLKDPYSRETARLDPRQIANWDGSTPVLLVGRFLYSDSAGTLYCTPFIDEYLPNNWANASRFGNVRPEDFCPPGSRR